MTDKIAVLCAAGSKQEARRIARRLVEQRLAACVNLVPGATSVYRWHGAVEESGEWLLLIKSRRGLFEKLRAEIERSHSYEVPEVVALPIVDGSEAYLNWMDHELDDGP